MRTEVHVRFDRIERDIVKDAQTHIGIALERDGVEARALSTIVSGGDVSHAGLVRAARGLALLVDACREQSAPAWWRENAVHEHAGEPGPIATVGLIADIDQFVTAMADVRSRQHREAQAALTLMAEALQLASAADPDPDE